MNMLILGVCGSPRKNQTSYQALSASLDQAAQVPGVRTEIIELAGKNVAGCIACGQCMKKPLTCSQEDDFIDMIPIISDPELGGIICASPIYFGAMTSQTKAFWDRCVMFRRNNFMLRNIVGGAIGVGGFRNGGQEITISSLHAIMLTQDMVIVGEGKPTAHLGGTCFSGGKDGLDSDDFGLATVKSLGQRVAELAVKLS